MLTNAKPALTSSGNNSCIFLFSLHSNTFAYSHDDITYICVITAFLVNFHVDWNEQTAFATGLLRESVITDMVVNEITQHSF